MKTVVLALLIALSVIVAGCGYLKPALAPGTDCSAGVVGDTGMEDVTGGAVDDTADDDADDAADDEETADEPEEIETSRGGLPVKTVSEGDLVEFPNLRATDPDGDPIDYTFTSPLNNEGEWQTKKGDAGEYKVVITASDGQATTKQEVIIKVISGNAAPTIELDDVSVSAGDTVVLAPKVSDPDGDEVTVSYSGWMTTNTKETTFDDAGTHDVIVTVEDENGATSSKKVTISVDAPNRDPIIQPISDLAIKEGDKIELLPRVSDPDDDDVTVAFSDPFDSKGVWQTGEGDAGIHQITVTADDGNGGTAEMKFLVAVETDNSAPVISGPSELSFDEGELIDLTEHFDISDAEGDDFTVEYSGWMTSATKQTGSDDQGEYEVTITADDGAAFPTAHTVTITVSDVNQAPVFDPDAFI